MPGRRNNTKVQDLWWQEDESGLQTGTQVTGSRRALSDHRLLRPTGYLIIHVVQSLCGMVIMYSLVLPIIHNQGLEMLQGLGIGM